MSKIRPAKIRNNVQDFDDPYIEDEALEENTICSHCGAIFAAGRWYLEGEVPKHEIEGAEPHATLCPACRKQRDRMPGGVLTLTGTFVDEHSDEILNLIRNESRKALSDNPLERIMDLNSSPEEIVINTTNEKLAQRLGKAINKAYSGHIEYKWSGDNKLVRVNWHRDD
ncbi:MAG: BCAM0308 family protein [Armatimonadota bacterium]|nr:zinc-ribbon domain-containing protein [bacterium]